MGQHDWTVALEKKRREGRCRIDGCREMVIDAAHVVPRSLGGGMGEHDTIPLCRIHHQQFDAHRLDILPYLTYEEQAAGVKRIGLERMRVRCLPSEYRR